MLREVAKSAMQKLHGGPPRNLIVASTCIFALCLQGAYKRIRLDSALYADCSAFADADNKLHERRSNG